MPRPEPDRCSDLPFRALWPFFAISFGLTWGSLALVLAAPGAIEALFGPVRAGHPLFVLSVYAPAMAALLLVVRHAGGGGVLRFLGRLGRWRAPAWAVALVLLGIPAIYIAGAWAKGSIDTFAPFGGLPAALAAIAFMLVLGPVEELGWRGVALPLLQRRMAPLWAGLVLGAVWGLWHLPAFLLPGTPQSGWGFLPFLAGAIAVSVILTTVFNATRGSLFWAAAFHFQLNNPLWPDAQPHDAALFAAVAAAMAWAGRRRMLAGAASAAREVIPPPRRAR